MRELKGKISITLDLSVIERLNVLSDESDRSISGCINLILKDYFKKLDNGNDEAGLMKF